MTPSAPRPIPYDRLGAVYTTPGVLLAPDSRDLWHYHISWVHPLRRNVAETLGRVSPSMRLRSYTFEHHTTGRVFGTYEGQTVYDAAVRCLVHSLYAEPDTLYTTVQGKPVSSFDMDKLKRAAKRLGLLSKLQRRCAACGSDLPFGKKGHDCGTPDGPVNADQAQYTPHRYRSI